MKLLFLSLFMLVAIVIVFGSHYFLFFSLAKFFGLVGKARLGLWLSLAFLSVSFIVASALVHYIDNGLTKGFYYLAGLWLGWLTYLFLGILILWALVLLGSGLGLSVNQKILASILAVVSISLTGYGIWNAGQIQVTRITVLIKNLPAAWQQQTIVQISDVHLGSVLGAQFINKIVDQINQLNPQAVVITGDYFDGMDGILDNLVAPLNRLHPAHGTYFVTGNHENYLGLDKTLKVIATAKLTILNNQVVDLAGISLVGISYPPEGSKQDVVEIIKTLKPSRPAILLYHAPAQVSAIAQTGIDLMLSGHTHKGQIWPFGYVAQLIFGKYYAGLNHINDFSIYTSVGVGSFGQDMGMCNKTDIVEITLVKE